MRTCFRFVSKDRPVGVSLINKPWDQKIDESQFFFQKAFGKEIFTNFNDKSILDFGCGEGQFTLAISREVPSARVVGLDIQNRFAKAIEEGKKRKITNFNFILGNSKSLKDESFDYVFSHDSFEHFEDPKEVLNEMIRVLKPGGYLLIKFGPTWMGPFGRHMFNVFRKDRPWMHLIIPEKSVMRIYSVIKRKSILSESYADYPDGLNKMTLKKVKALLKSNKGANVVFFYNTNYLEGNNPLKKLLKPLLFLPPFNELLSKEVIAMLQRM